MFLQIILFGILLCVVLVYINGIYNEYYWKKRGVIFHKKNKTLGPMWDFITKDKAVFEVIHDIYNENLNAPAIGMGSIFSRALYVTDIKNIQHVLQGDHQAFNHRGTDFTQDDILADNILFMHGNRWKLVRQSMSPLFTSAKLKSMYYIIDKSAKDFVKHLQERPENLNENTFELLMNFCCAAIGAAVFGISSKSIFELPFLYMANESLAPTFKRNLKFAFSRVSMWLAKKLKITFFKEHEAFFVGAIKQLLRQREKEGVNKHDFADLCISLQRKGMLRDSDTGLEIEPTDELMAGQGFFFFIAGVEPTAAALLAVLIELGRHSDILDKVQQEIDVTFEKHNGDLTYDAVNGMGYLDKVLNEALRLHPPIGYSTRLCTRNSTLPVGNIKVEKGTKIFTPIYDLHYESKYYENPDVFDPERFDQDNKNGDYSYLPFGKGSRICIGMRYARLQVKAGLVHLLRKFTVKSSVDGKLKYLKHPIQVRIKNAKVELLPRKVKNN